MINHGTAGLEPAEKKNTVCAVLKHRQHERYALVISLSTRCFASTPLFIGGTLSQVDALDHLAAADFEVRGFTTCPTACKASAAVHRLRRAVNGHEAATEDGMVDEKTSEHCPAPSHTRMGKGIGWAPVWTL